MSKVTKPDQGAFCFTWDDPTDGGRTRHVQDGLSKREYFAALALQGMIANPEPMEDKFESIVKTLAEGAVQYADALIEALNRGPEPK